MGKVTTTKTITTTKSKMKTRKKMLLMSVIFVLVFTGIMIYFIYIGKTLNDILIDKFYSFCIWCVVGSGVCGAVGKRNEPCDTTNEVYVESNEE